MPQGLESNEHPPLLRAWGLGPAALWGWLTQSWELLGTAWPGAGPAWPFLTGGGVAALVLSLDLELLQTKEPTLDMLLTLMPCLAQLQLLPHKPCWDQTEETILVVKPWHRCPGKWWSHSP